MKRGNGSRGFPCTNFGAYVFMPKAFTELAHVGIESTHPSPRLHAIFCG